MTEQTTEAALTATFKAGRDFDAPWLVVRADNPAQMVQQIEYIQQTGLGAVIGNAARDFQGAYNVGTGLAATPVNAPAQAPAPVAAAPVAAPPAQGPGGFPAAPTWGAPAAAPAAAPVAAPAATDGSEGPWIPGLGMASKVKTGIAKSGRSVGQQWVRYEDPRAWTQIKDLVKTKDINDPGIAAGTHRYEQYAN